MKISPGGKKVLLGVQNRVLPGVKIKCTRGPNWKNPHKHWLCVDAPNFDPRQHSILTLQQRLILIPRAIFKTAKSCNYYLYFLKETICIFGKKKYSYSGMVQSYFLLGNPFNRIPLRMVCSSICFRERFQNKIPANYPHFVDKGGGIFSLYLAIIKGKNKNK